jgi:hypothetical protein
MRLQDRAEEPDHRHRRLLRPRRERPGRRRAAEQRDELAALHSITSSARPSSGSGTVRPSAFSVWGSFMQRTDDTTLPSRGQCQDRASEDRFGCKIGKVRCEHIESLYPRSRPMRGHPSTVSSFQFGKYRTKSCSTSGHPAVGVAFHSRVQATAEVPSRLNDQQTCYRRASQFSRIIFAIVCVEHRERQP